MIYMEAVGIISDQVVIRQTLYDQKEGVRISSHQYTVKGIFKVYLIVAV